MSSAVHECLSCVTLSLASLIRRSSAINMSWFKSWSLYAKVCQCQLSSNQSLSLSLSLSLSFYITTITHIDQRLNTHSERSHRTKVGRTDWKPAYMSHMLSLQWRLCSFSVSSVLQFMQNQKSIDYSWVRTRTIGVEGEHSDHLTIIMAPKSLYLQQYKNFFLLSSILIKQIFNLMLCFSNLGKYGWKEPLKHA